MEYTKNYKLPQWAETDRILMEDFNQMCMNIDNSLVEASLPHCVTGTYTGNGKPIDQGGVKVEVGFRPRFVIITRSRISPSNPSSTVMIGEGGVDGTEHYVIFQDDGFQVNYLSVYGTNTTPLRLNESGLVYSYVAFR